jgi:hypothetical protein
MWEPQCLTTLWAFTVFYRVALPFYLLHHRWSSHLRVLEWNMSWGFLSDEWSTYSSSRHKVFMQVYGAGASAAMVRFAVRSSCVSCGCSCYAEPSPRTHRKCAKPCPLFQGWGATTWHNKVGGCTCAEAYPVSWNRLHCGVSSLNCRWLSFWARNFLPLFHQIDYKQIVKEHETVYQDFIYIYSPHFIHLDLVPPTNVKWSVQVTKVLNL